MSNILKQHAIKHYGGLEANLPARLPYGDTYLTSDTGRFFKYNVDGLPQEITTGSISEVEEIIKTNILQSDLNSAINNGSFPEYLIADLSAKLDERFPDFITKNKKDFEKWIFN